MAETNESAPAQPLERPVQASYQPPPESIRTAINDTWGANASLKTADFKPGDKDEDNGTKGVANQTHDVKDLGQGDGRSSGGNSAGGDGSGKRGSDDKKDSGKILDFSPKAADTIKNTEAQKMLDGVSIGPAKESDQKESAKDKSETTEGRLAPKKGPQPTDKEGAKRELKVETEDGQVPDKKELSLTDKEAAKQGSKVQTQDGQIPTKPVQTAEKVGAKQELKVQTQDGQISLPPADRAAETRPEKPAPEITTPPSTGDKPSDQKNADSKTETGEKAPEHGSAEQSSEASSSRNQRVLLPENFAQVGKDVIGKIDTDKKGYVTKEQVTAALQDPQFKGQEAQALAGLYSNFDKIANLGHSKGFLESSSINNADLDKANTMIGTDIADRGKANELNTWMQNNGRLYGDGKGELSRADIDKGLKDPSIPEEDRQALTSLKQLYSDISASGNAREGAMVPGDRSKISGEDVRAYRNELSQKPEAQLTTGVFDSTYAVYEEQNKNISKELYSTENPLDSIKADTIKQGPIGNCYFQAPLSSLAQSNPEAIRDAIKDNKDGTYTVTFPGAADKPVTVKAPTDAERGLYSGFYGQGNPNGTWASVMEKAYGQFRNDNLNWFRGDTPQKGSDGGGLPSKAIELLTGNDSTSYSTTWSQSAIAKRFDEAFKDGKQNQTITADTAELFSRSGVTKDGYPKTHAYGITGFDKNGPDGGTLTVRNPWGGPDGTTHGTSQISMKKFMENFTTVSFENRKK